MPKFFGEGEKFRQLPLQNRLQQSLMDKAGKGLQAQGMPDMIGQTQNYNQGQNYLADLYSQSPDAFQRMSQPYMQQFQQQTVPDIAERFSSMGSGSAGGSGLNQALAQGATNLNTNLGGMFENMRSQNLVQNMQYGQAPFDQFRSLLMSLLGMNTFENTYQPGNTGFLGPFLQGAGQGLGQLGTAFFG